MAFSRPMGVLYSPRLEVGRFGNAGVLGALLIREASCSFGAERHRAPTWACSAAIWAVTSPFATHINTTDSVDPPLAWRISVSSLHARVWAWH